MKKSSVLAIGAICVLSATGYAATIVPTTGVTGNIVAQNQTGGTGATVSYVPSNYVAGDNNSLGQTFTTSTLGLNNKLDAIYVQTGQGTGVGDRYAQGGSLMVTLFQITGTRTTPAADNRYYTATQLAQETMTWSEATGGHQISSTWLKIDLSTTITLSDSTLYGIALASAGVGSNPSSGAFFQWNGTNPTSYADGQAITTGAANVFNINDIWRGETATDAGDRVFAITTVPEPSAALLGGLGMLALLRRRRH